MSSPLTLMVQGTTSDAGKSTLVAGLARVLHRRGLKVAPFKPQNMAPNAALTADGGQIGRAQALQAAAAGLAPHADFNPVLLKPGSDVGAEVIIHGRSVGRMSARDFHAFKPRAKVAVMESWARLCAQYDVLLVEGAGSPAEINLRAGDIANMGFAEAADVPVVLVADIDRGGVFAHLVGTLELLSASEQARVRGFVINRFRGDPSLLQPGLDWLEERTGRKVFGVLPYLQDLYLDAEDALATTTAKGAGEPLLRVVAPVYPRISNHTDADPLRLHPQLDFRWVRAGEPLPPADLVLLLGSQSVQSDLAWLRAQGWDEHIRRHLRYGGKLLGICGGFQMLGRSLSDPLGLEGPPATVAGLGWLEVDTVLDADKLQGEVSGRLTAAVGGAGASVEVKGYEIHHGRSSGEGLRRPALQLERNGNREDDGALSADGQVLGTYVHGLFDAPAALAAVLRWAGLDQVAAVEPGARREAELERLADMVEQHCDLEALFDHRLSRTMRS